MAKAHGKDSYLQLDDSAGTLRDIGQYCDNIETDRSWDMAESTTMGLEDKEFLPGLGGGAITFSGKWDDAATTGPDVVLHGIGGLETSSSFVFGPSGNAAGKVKYTGESYLENFKVSAPLEGVVKFSGTLRVTGAVTKGVFP